MEYYSFQVNREGNQTYNDIFNYTAGDQIILEFEAEASVQGNNSCTASSRIQFDSAVFVNGNGTISNLPIQEGVIASV